ncbi:hypothetical protein [Jiangella alkaliphila]|uniref:Uncharacterized protein n=1 Tax=Jiangella alkaliphila TaxID=419479 RepID=A0A1H2IK41_9ACTN|nr:hypothetical protein [Jiangella alkaliphila]SDU44325.1 hypothetical protein SAMN04488563_1779 [Jiangella alkaliphila]
MATMTQVQRPTLVGRWVTVTDISGRSRTELRWVAVQDERPAHVRAA